jgi:hypothetical protein
VTRKLSKSLCVFRAPRQATAEVLRQRPGPQPGHHVAGSTHHYGTGLAGYGGRRTWRVHAAARPSLAMTSRPSPTGSLCEGSCWRSWSIQRPARNARCASCSSQPVTLSPIALRAAHQATRRLRQRRDDIMMAFTSAPFTGTPKAAAQPPRHLRGLRGHAMCCRPRPTTS